MEMHAVGRETGKRWPVLASTLGLSLVGFVLVTRDKEGRITASWAFFLEPLGAVRCRLIERIRIRYSFDLGGLFWGLIFEPADFVMMRKQMLNLKRRAEHAIAADALGATLWRERGPQPGPHQGSDVP